MIVSMNAVRPDNMIVPLQVNLLGGFFSNLCGIHYKDALINEKVFPCFVFFLLKVKKGLKIVVPFYAILIHIQILPRYLHLMSM